MLSHIELSQESNRTSESAMVRQLNMLSVNVVSLQRAEPILLQNFTS